jgi:hypothetical protein
MNFYKGGHHGAPHPVGFGEFNKNMPCEVIIHPYGESKNADDQWGKIDGLNIKLIIDKLMPAMRITGRVKDEQETLLIPRDSLSALPQDSGRRMILHCTILLGNLNPDEVRALIRKSLTVDLPEKVCKYLSEVDNRDANHAKWGLDFLYICVHGLQTFPVGSTRLGDWLNNKKSNNLLIVKERVRIVNPMIQNLCIEMMEETPFQFY